MEKEIQKNQLRLVTIGELEFWIETMEALIIKKHAIKGTKNYRFNCLVRAYFEAIKSMGGHLDINKFNTLTINGIEFKRIETQNETFNGKSQKSNPGQDQ